VSGGGTALLGEAVPSDTAILVLFIWIVNGKSVCPVCLATVGAGGRCTIRQGPAARWRGYWRRSGWPFKAARFPRDVKDKKDGSDGVGWMYNRGGQEPYWKSWLDRKEAV
jgi:hypothetical protein